MELRETFDTAAELYDRARPGYPADLFDDVAAITGVQPPARLLEIGPGTGKATVALAQRGYAITAVELGSNLAAVARRNLAAYPAVTVEVGAFEDWPLPREAFDLIYSATAFAWVDPDIRLQKSAAALRAGGWLAVWNTTHAAGGTEQFFIDVQECYERHMPGTPPGLRLTPVAAFADDSLDLDRSNDFEPPVFRRYAWDVEYTTQTYLDMLGTYSNHIALDEAGRSALFTCIAGLIDGNHGGAITKRYLTLLTLARRR